MIALSSLYQQLAATTNNASDPTSHLDLGV